MKILLAPHNDDETLFAAFTCQRERPLILFVTDCYVQATRTPKVTWSQRREESIAAAKVLGCSVGFLGFDDRTVTEAQIALELDAYSGHAIEEVYAPMLQGGHPHHDMVHRAATAVFSKVRCYGTYSYREKAMATEGVEVYGTKLECCVKAQAMACYTSQHVWSAHHFAAATHGLEFISD